MKISLYRESRAGETRVALTPDAVKTLVADGWTVEVQRGAGALAHFSDDAYSQVGAVIVDAPAGDVNLRVNPPTLSEVAALPEGATHLSFLSPLLSLDVVRAMNERRITILSFDLLPRISRAQYMDALSSQATVSGYRAALAGASHFDRFFPLLTTAAGTIRPAKVLVMGVGVAGLQAIATAKRLGSKVRAYDVRSAAKEEAESAGAVFVKLGVTADAAGGYARELTDEERAQQQAALLSEVANADIVITTAAVPGRKAPILLTSAMVEAMSEGSLVIDMAADGGGNCELTVAGEVVDHHGVRIVGLANPPAQMGASASFMYANNVLKLLALFGAKGTLAPDWSDEVVVGVTVARDGQVNHAATAEALGVDRVEISSKESE
ncbi:MAG: NAD(P) transhydrogenase subunit alpha [Acidobacteriota bacterium]|nr:NAD(P) transhydrogenase subunit alpha [Acidobacteriota bacterium]MDE3031668.1 NAD(P) transhydrogenase subunit alpha [Acidobacteriota bacterium]MDE3093394.1 NAD(P) transhydrogenase subunit alpha [Acidobacteriota bacterium]MDE3139224.1 NAD(P) transhydrogenase subunit alpha [Acidobacteriota bacterium]MDE3146151.1 NAD(P) transhydrogenase subunit alpha [Acidobacteriota bacterium]